MYVHFLTSNLKILKAFWTGTNLTEIKSCKFPANAKKKNGSRKAKEEGRRENEKVKVETAVSRRFGSLEPESDQQPTLYSSFLKNNPSNTQKQKALHE